MLVVVRVIDVMGRPVPGATVDVLELDVPVAHAAVTDERGAARLNVGQGEVAVFVSIGDRADTLLAWPELGHELTLIVSAPPPARPVTPVARGHASRATSPSPGYRVYFLSGATITDPVSGTFSLHYPR
ncbi:MAG: hypothetical protein H6735_14690 [Alphaproteobacteria bacterium]|nr:hypothetical protein [Alphaproteobacteria bacterium]